MFGQTDGDESRSTQWLTYGRSYQKKQKVCVR